MQESWARAEARQRLSRALGEVGSRADAAMVTMTDGVHPNLMSGSFSPMMGCIETRLLENPDKFEGQDSLSWKYIAKTKIRAALPNIRVLLVKAEEKSGDVRNVVLNDPERVPSVYALDKVQATGEGRERSGGCLAVPSQAVHAVHEVGSSFLQLRTRSDLLTDWWASQ